MQCIVMFAFVSMLFTSEKKSIYPDCDEGDFFSKNVMSSYFWSQDGHDVIGYVGASQISDIQIHFLLPIWCSMIISIM